MNYYTGGTDTSEPDKVPNKKIVVGEMFEWVDAVVMSVIVIILIFSFAFRSVGISGESMEDTLHGGDRVVISDIFYKPKQGDIVVVSRNYGNERTEITDIKSEANDDEPIIKRVIATEGQTVFIDFENSAVYVDGVLLKEDYIKTPTTFINGSTDMQNPQVVDKGKVFVMGDNRQKSLDSRSSVIGQVDERYILGKAILKIYPLSEFGGLY